MYQWRKLMQAAAVAALGLSAAWVFAYGRVSDPSDALMRLVLGYPLFLVILCISIAPGIYLAKRLQLNPWWALPTTSILMLVAIGAVKNWPPRPAAAIFGALATPSGYVLGFPIEWWKGYLYNLWPYAFTAGIGAFLFLIVCRSMRIHSTLAKIELKPSLTAARGLRSPKMSNRL